MIPTNAPVAPALRIVVLAAGFSLRLGQPKALARIRGKTLIRRSVELLAPLVESPIIVVLPVRAHRIRGALRGCRVSFVENRRRAEGMSTSVARGLLQNRYGASLLLPVDLAELSRRDVERLIVRWRGSRRRIAARNAEGSAVTPLILPRRFRDSALKISGDRGLKGWVARLNAHDLVLVHMPSAEFDADTPGDLQRARRRRGGG